LILDILAILTGLNAVLDLVSLIRFSGATIASVRNDAAAFSAEVAPILPAAGWAVVWSILAVIMLGAAVYFSHIRQRRII
jgi:hypothetical protein